MKEPRRSKSRRPPAFDGATAATFRNSHLALARRKIMTDLGPAEVTVDRAESPLAWLACRRGRDGRPLLAAHQFIAGERLRADFTVAQLMPRMTTDWSLAVDGIAASGAETNATEAMIAARQRVHQALEAAGPEFAGLLFDVCCFLKGLEDVERERAWPHGSAKIVLRLALERLARHYGYAGEARGPARAALRRWSAADDGPADQAARSD